MSIERDDDKINNLLTIVKCSKNLSLIIQISRIQINKLVFRVLRVYAYNYLYFNNQLYNDVDTNLIRT